MAEEAGGAGGAFPKRGKDFLQQNPQEGSPRGFKRSRTHPHHGHGYADNRAAAYGGNSGYGYGGHHGVGGYNAGFDSGFFAVRLRGLPFSATEHDVERFLGFSPVDVLKVYRDGQFSGQALVVVPQKQVEVAVLQMHGMMMGRRYIEAFPASRWDYYNAIKAVPSDGDAAIPSRDRSANPPQQQPKEVGDCKILKLRGMPWEITAQDVVDWFNDAEVIDASVTGPGVDQVFIVKDRQGRSTGVGFAEFPSTADAQEAIKKDTHRMGRRYIELFPVTEDERDKYVKKDAPCVQAPNPPPEEKKGGEACDLSALQP